MLLKYFIIVIVASAYARITVTDKPNLITNLLDETVKDSWQNRIINDSRIVEDSNENHVTETSTQQICVEPNELDNVIGLNFKLCEPEVKVDNGTALILTPFIKEGRINEARNACRVNPEVFLDFESYSGFLTVNETYNSNLFFWYFPVLNKPVNETPWIIWLQGGPGVSSLTGLFDEIGPFTVNSEEKLILNNYTWLQNHSLVFVDNPVGTGFSFTEHSHGYATNMETYSTHLYKMLRQFLQIFPELRTAPLYIAGESYAGKYVPAFGLEIHNHIDKLGSDINFQGIIIGNGYMDPAMISNLPMNYYHFGLIDKTQLEIIQPFIDSFQRDIAENKSVQAKSKWTTLVSLVLLLSNQKQGYNFLKDDLVIGQYFKFLLRSEVKRALHVGDIKLSFLNVTVNFALAPDFLSSTRPHIETLLENYRVLVYCGQLDQMLACPIASENYRTWRWSRSQEFTNSSRYPFMYHNKLAGYHKSGGGFSEVVVRGAGHMAASDAPGPMQHLITHWTHKQRLSWPPPIFDNKYLTELIANTTRVSNL